MRSARWFFTFGVLMLVLSGILVDVQDGFFSGILVAGGVGAVVGSINAFLGGLNGQ